jgi:hypothetical protein
VPIFEQYLSVVGRGVRAFLNLEAGLTRADAAPPGPLRVELERQLGEAHQELAELRSKPAANGANTEDTGIKPENLVWIFGNRKTGSTWLSWMMGELEGHTVWREPYVGELFGRLYYDWDNWVGEKHFESKHFILGGPQRESWLRSIRSFVLSEATARFPEVANEGYLTIKEPNGSVGAPLLMEALPESRMIFLVRDPRDVAASVLDAFKKGSYMREQRKSDRHAAMFEMQADDLVKMVATDYLRNVGNAREAYKAHAGRKVFVRYEDLRPNPSETMKRLCTALGIGVEESELERAVQKHSWENIPEEEKGGGKFHRKARPGGWREDLTPEQARIVEGITAPLLEELYSPEVMSEGRL